MVDLALLQSVSYMAGALGVCIGALSFAFNMRASERNRRIQLVSQMSNDLINFEGYSKYFDLLNMEWRDYDDFEKKYGSDFNVHAASQRFSVWLTFNKLGYMLSKGLVDAEDIYEMGGMNCIMCWAKWEAIIRESRRRYNGADYLSYFEYLASEMNKMKLRKAPSYVLPKTLVKYVPDK
ncbi:MAG: hypothetical protein NTY03_08385 [Candidatus Bathyarchaeota archaeon]|nr:hypothetical protein [Candidatus Bathyarchaeota archaeon]